MTYYRRILTNLFTLVLVFVFSAACVAKEKSAKKDGPNDTVAKDVEKGWTRIFDGKTLDGWKASEASKNWTVKDGCIEGRGSRSHLFYLKQEYVNFEFKAEIYTEPKTNSGIYFHTKYQKSGWPKYGHEVQVNNTQSDPVKTGSLYNVKKIFKSPATDKKWWTQHIIVKGKRIIIKVDGKTVIDYTEPDDVKGGRKISKGLFALQQHDPGGVVRYRNLRTKKLSNESK